MYSTLATVIETVNAFTLFENDLTGPYPLDTGDLEEIQYSVTDSNNQALTGDLAELIFIDGTTKMINID